MIVYRIKYYTDNNAPQLNLYEEFIKNYKETVEHPQWVEDLKHECDTYIQKNSTNPSNLTFSDWLIEHTPTGQRTVESYREHLKDAIDEFIQGPAAPRKLMSDITDKYTELRNYLDDYYPKEKIKKIGDILNIDILKNEIPSYIDFSESLGNIHNSTIIMSDDELKNLLTGLKDTIDEGIRLAESNSNKVRRYSKFNVEDLKKDTEALKELLTNDVIGYNKNIKLDPKFSSFQFNKKTVSLSKADVGRLLKLSEIVEYQVYKTISTDEGLMKFITDLNPSRDFNATIDPDKWVEDGLAKNKKLGDAMKTAKSNKERLKLALDFYNIKSEQELYFRYIEELSARAKCDSLTELYQLLLNPKQAKQLGLTIQPSLRGELKNLLNDDIAERLITKMSIADPKTLENSMIILQKTEEEIEKEIEKAGIKRSKDTTITESKDIPSFEDTSKKTGAPTKSEPAPTRKGGSFWKKAVNWVKEHPVKTSLGAAGAIAIGYAVHKAIQYSNEDNNNRPRRDERFNEYKSRLN